MGEEGDVELNGDQQKYPPQHKISDSQGLSNAWFDVISLFIGAVNKKFLSFSFRFHCQSETTELFFESSGH